MSADNQNVGSGGAAAQVGIGYQNRVAAWMCVRILAERDVTPLWRLNANITFDYIRCETGQPVDDILVGTSEAGHAFIPATHLLTSNIPSRKAEVLIRRWARQSTSSYGNSYLTAEKLRGNLSGSGSLT